ncbi:uncharacterized protein [Solanum tuberosum]|uniref:uncharacterized protein n=1 Tax=Solanum tuberosum TaxID=4113 RepID=UPI00073A1333|nr:PREDICTED: uncharacterized protein LOC102606285 [Solanum tuberosum]
MKPSLLTKESIPTASRSATLQPMGLSDGGCPVGTVPIRRYTKEDVIRQKLLPPPEDTVHVVDPPLTNRDNFNDSKTRRIKPLKGYKLAIVSTEDNPNNKFGGASMIAAIYNPRSTGQQHSACRLKLIKGKNIIQTGWRDQEKGNWWLFLDNVAIGFWPKEVFDDFGNFATKVEWGGVVYSPAGVLEPPMGSGLYPLMRSTTVNAYCRVITLLNDKGQNIDLLGSKLPTFSTTPMLYTVIDVPNYPGLDYNHTILYGGPGEI